MWHDVHVCGMGSFRFLDIEGTTIATWCFRFIMDCGDSSPLSIYFRFVCLKQRTTYQIEKKTKAAMNRRSPYKSKNMLLCFTLFLR
jgi:hypothetical protein